MIKRIKGILLRISLVETLAKRYSKVKQTYRFKGSNQYWIERYRKGGNSGCGSYGKHADFKAKIVNKFVKEHNVKSVIEFGCGDGNQLKKLRFQSYVGFDISPEAILHCRDIFQNDASKSFKLMHEYDEETAELSVSMDVIFHLVEDSVFESYMERMFNTSTRFALFYSSNTNEQNDQQYPHMKHRKFTEWVEKHIKDWSLMTHIPNNQFPSGNISTRTQPGFFIYRKV